MLATGLSRSMTMLRKITFGLFVVCLFTFVGFNMVNTYANGDPLISMIDGASIRAQDAPGGQGLKFSATFDESLLGQTRGFFVVYGEATQAQLEAVLENEPMELNGKAVYKTENYDITTATISVVLTGIPNGGYGNGVTVFAYTRVGEVYSIVPAGVTRSIAEVAMRAAKQGESGSVANVLLVLGQNYYKVAWDEFGKYAVSNSLYEYDRELLREQFIADWNDFAGTSWDSLNAATFFNSAKNGLVDAIGSNKDLSSSRIYAFFNDAVYGWKWGWLLDYITSVDGTIHPSRQIVAIQGNGTNGDFVLYHADHLSYSIANFFNRAYVLGGYSAINFSSPTNDSKYNNLALYNDRVFAEFSSYQYVNSGNAITLPTAPVKDHYTFLHYNDGTSNFGQSTSYTVSATKKLTPIYSANSFAITYYDGEDEITTLSPTTYTVETSTITLPTYNLEGYVFNGWYDNAEFTGSSIETIPNGSSGNKVFYAKKTATANVEVEVTYNLNGGQLNSTDLYTIRTSETKVVATRYHTSTGYINGNDITINTYSRASWYVIGLKPTGISGIYEVIGKGVNYTHAEATLYFMMHDNCISSYKATWQSQYNSLVSGSLIIIENIPETAGSGLSIDVYFIAASEATANVVVPMTDSGPMLAPVRVGYTFAGWCEESDCSDEPITTYPGYTSGSGITEKTYYAKWVAN